jgi:toxin ParE1/3/4
VQIVWLPLALQDLVSIRLWYGEAAGEPTANAVIQNIVRSAGGLRDNPARGRPSQSTDGIHELVVPRSPYVLPYRVVADRIEILRVFDGRRAPLEDWDA